MELTATQKFELCKMQLLAEQCTIEQLATVYQPLLMQKTVHKQIAEKFGTGDTNLVANDFQISLDLAPQIAAELNAFNNLLQEDAVDALVSVQAEIYMYKNRWYDKLFC